MNNNVTGATVSDHNNKTLHPRDEEAFQTIDAMAFSGNGFDERLESRQRIKYFLNRWNRRMAEVEADTEEALDDAHHSMHKLTFNQWNGQSAMLILSKLLEATGRGPK